MYNYLVLMGCIFPLIGVFLMERGAYGVSIGRFGYPHGAFWAYLAYVFILLSVYFLQKKRLKALPNNLTIQNNFFRKTALNVSLIHVVMLLVMIFLFNAHDVFLGNIAKGEFRASLGTFGSLAYLMTNFISPCTLAYVSFLYINTNRERRNKLLLVFALCLGFIFGSTWGFKATGVSIILPSLVVIYWNASFLTFLKVGSFGFFIIFISAIFFDGMNSFSGLINSLWIRLTVIQGDVSWFIWGEYSDGVEFPPYIKTWAAIVGGKLLTAILGTSRDDYQVWAEYHFDILINQIAGLPLEVVLEGHSIVGTPFSEGLVMLGLPGVFIMAVFGGCISAYIFNLLQKSLIQNKGINVALLTTYFSIFVFSWLRGGALVQLFHISVWIGLIFSYVTIVFMKRITFVKTVKPHKN